MRKESDALLTMRTFELIPATEIPKSTEILPSRFVYALKRNGTYKARLVAGGHRQNSYAFSDGSSSPTADISSLKIFLGGNRMNFGSGRTEFK